MTFDPATAPLTEWVERVAAGDPDALAAVHEFSEIEVDE